MYDLRKDDGPGHLIVIDGEPVGYVVKFNGAWVAQHGTSDADEFRMAFGDTRHEAVDRVVRPEAHAWYYAPVRVAS